MKIAKQKQKHHMERELQITKFCIKRKKWNEKTKGVVVRSESLLEMMKHPSHAGIKNG